MALWEDYLGDGTQSCPKGEENAHFILIYAEYETGRFVRIRGREGLETERQDHQGAREKIL